MELEFYTSVSLPYFTYFPTLLPSGKHMFFLSVFESVMVLMFAHLFCVLDSTYKQNHIVFVFLCMFTLYMSMFTWDNSLQVHTCCHRWQNLLLLYGRVILHCKYAYHIFIFSSTDGTGCFHILIIVYYVAVNTGVYISF